MLGWMPAGRLADPGSMPGQGRGRLTRRGQWVRYVRAEDSRCPQKEKRGGFEAASLSYFQSPVWPSGDWLPSCCIERATQVGGWFGLAIARFPRVRGCLNISFCGVQELARRAQAACRRRGRRTGGRRRPDGRSRPGARGSGGCARSRAARAAASCAGRRSIDLEVGDRRRAAGRCAWTPPCGRARSRPIGASIVPLSASGRPLDQRQVLAPHLARARAAPGSARVGRLGLRHHQQPRRVAVEAVDDARRAPGRRRPRRGRAAPRARVGPRWPGAGCVTSPAGLSTTSRSVVLVDDLELRRRLGRGRRRSASLDAARPPRPAAMRWLFGPRARRPPAPRPASIRRCAAAREPRPPRAARKASRRSPASSGARRLARSRSWRSLSTT